MKNNVDYVISSELEEAIKVSEITGRPLLLKGEPGTGKTLLAEHYANSKGYPLFKWHVKSTTQAKEGLYFYDALTRLNDSRFAAVDGKDVSKISDYIKLEPMGQAFDCDEKSVLLIDEIDKADIEFPNDLLLEIDKMEFYIHETSTLVEAKHRPLVFITSNNEKELPDAFLRRCIFHYIHFPDEEMMNKIVCAHYPDIDQSFLKAALQMFYQLREDNDLEKKPATSELIDWIKILLHQGAKLPKGTKVPFIGTLLKNEKDLFRYH